MTIIIPLELKTDTLPQERPFYIGEGTEYDEFYQIWIQQIKDIGKVDIIKHVNFNLGCPSSRVQENMLGLALTQKYDLVKKCLYELIKYNKDVSVKCRLGLGMNEDKSYIFDYLKLFNEIGIKKVFIHCRNGVLNLDTKKNRTIPKINYNLFLKNIILFFK